MIGQVALKKPATLIALGLTGNMMSAQYKAILDYATVQGFTLPSVANRVKQNTFLAALRSAGIWEELDVFYNFYTDGDANFAKINWKNPGTFQAVGTGHEPTFTPLSGFTGNGTSQYLNTQWAPSAGVFFQQTESSVFMDAVVPAPAGVFQLSGSHSGSANSAFFAWASGAIYFDTNSAALFNFSSPTVNGMYHANRIGSIGNQSKWFLEGGLFYTANDEWATPRTAFPVFLLANNDAATPTRYAAGTLRMWGAGASLRGKELILQNLWYIYKGGTPYDTSYQAILSYASLQGFALPTMANRTKQNALVIALKSAGIWDELDVFYNFYTDGDHNFAKINWKNPGTYQSVGTGHEPTFTVNSGFKGNETTMYLSTLFRPSDSAFPVGDMSYFVDIADITTAGLTSDLGCLGPAANDYTLLRVKLSGTDLTAYLNGSFAATFAGASAAAQKVYHVQRSGGNLSLYMNGVLFGTVANLLQFACAAQPIFLLAANNNATPIQFTSRTMRCFAWGKGLVGKELAFYNAWNTYKT